MSAAADQFKPKFPPFCDGIDYFADPWPEFDTLGAEAVLGPDRPAVTDVQDRRATYQTLMAADALRYLTVSLDSPSGQVKVRGY